jgi:hypothetical protein
MRVEDSGSLVEVALVEIEIGPAEDVEVEAKETSD